MQTFADDLAGEYVRHFTQQELVIGAEAEARLAKTLIKQVFLEGTLAVAQEMRSKCSCIVKVEHYANAVTEDDLLQARSHCSHPCHSISRPAHYRGDHPPLQCREEKRQRWQQNLPQRNTNM